ncbi:MAG: inosine/xanthosine triphosphatase [Ardenticatenia bacterium]|nr:inosine/xanthosine triphosphatase [Ardenticatena maritima]KPL87808.1 hypothetical protein SE16_09610 [Ardenticatena maritima]RME13668.1 MAG: inosine/xanthosine triphosphatase [Ardenticatenia bacterium]
MPIVVVGSRNPVKVAAVQAAFAKLGDAWEVRAVDAPSGVSPQPIGHAETRRGARNRAQAALAAYPNAEFGVGLEGGVFEYDGEWYTGAWCAIVDRDGRVGWAGGGLILLPPAVVEGLRAGHELGTLMDRLSDEHNTKQKMGAIGLLTNGLVGRQETYEHLVLRALARWRRPEWFESEEEAG